MRSSFENIYILWYARLKNFALTYVLRDSDAEDVVQDVFTRLYERQSLPAREEAMAGYLFQAVKNACLNLLRERLAAANAEKRLRSTLQMELRLRYDSLGQMVLVPETEEDIVEILDRALARLPEKCRIIFVKSRLEGMRQADIAREMNISINTVETQMGIAYKRLRQELKDYLPLFLFLFCAFECHISQ